MRIVSLIASATETVAALGCADRLVGVSHECDWPPMAVVGRPVVTRPKVDVTRCSLDIHRDVEAIVARGLGVYEIDVQVLRRLKPDLIITQDQCEVCAVTREDVVRATQECLDSEVEIVTLHPDSLDDIFEDILKVGRALQVEDRGREVVENLRGKMEGIASQAKKWTDKPRVVCLEWLSPLMVAGNWMPQLVAMAGGINGLTRNGEHTKVITPRELTDFDPDRLLVMPCGFKIPQTLENRNELESIPGFQNLKAVQEGDVYIIDGNTYMNRPGPRILESLIILAGLTHSGCFDDQIPKGAVLSWPRR